MPSRPALRAFLCVVACFIASLSAQVPQLINYQGRVAVGSVNFDGAGRFRFALVNATGTTTYWSNDGTSTGGSAPTAAVSLTVTKGLYSVLLGDTTLPNMQAVPASVFANSDVRLRVWFNDGVNGTQLLTPDQRIAAVGYALMAANVPDGSITAAKLAPGAFPSFTTTGTQPLDFQVNGIRGLRLYDPGDSSDSDTATDGAPNLIAGAPSNSIAAGTVGSTIAGGGATAYFGTTFYNSIAGNFSFIGSGYSNVIETDSPFALIGAGRFNAVRTGSGESSILGGLRNEIHAGAFRSVIGGGEENTVQAGATFSVVAGGYQNSATGGYAFVAGGDANTAGAGSFAGGHRAKATHFGSFVWADSTDVDFPSTANNQFSVRAAGGARLETAGAGLTIDGTKLKPLAWQVVAGTTQQAAPNTGYVLTHATQQVAVVLPTTPEVGDVVRMTGAGRGGWKLVLNAGQTVLGAEIGRSDDWTPRTISQGMLNVASSLDGNKLVAVGSLSQIYTSTDAGATWVARDAQRYWHAVASSADGNKLVAGIDGGGIYVSTDSGATWALRPVSGGNRIWEAFAFSADGSKLVALAHFGETFTSTNDGVTWVTRSSQSGCYNLTTSADGNKLAAAGNGYIYTSSDAGATWTQRESSRHWTGIASSADGNKLVACAYDGLLYTSTNAGVSWTARESSRVWRGVASSSDGSKLAAVVSGGQIYLSTDAGLTWTPHESIRTWNSIATSGDGNKLVTTGNGTVYTKQMPESLSGGWGTAAELQYIGNGQFLLLSRQGTLSF